MRQHTLKSLYALHSWIGLVLGLVLYVVCFSGVVALFEAELGPWQRGVGRPAPAPAGSALDKAVSATVERLADQEGAARAMDFLVLLPGSYGSVIIMQYAAGSPPRPATRYFDPWTGEPTTPPGTAATAILRQLHTDLLLPAPWGRYLVGLSGVVMLVSVVSGLLLHRKMLTEMFTLRLFRSTRLKWADTHKSLGLWGLPFHFVIALTGAVLGWVGLALPLAALTAHEGDMAAAASALGGFQAEARGIPAEMQPLSALLARAQVALPGLDPAVAVFRHYGDAGATVEVMGDVPGRLVYYPSVSLAGATGKVMVVTDWSVATPGKRIYAMVTPLHYGSYGGLGLKLLYALLGAGSCVLIVSGLRIWLSRPGSNSRKQSMERLAAGVFLGLPLAIAGLFCAVRLVPAPVAASEAVMMAIFLALWSAALLWPWLREPGRATWEMLAATGIALLACPVLTGFVARTDLVSALGAGAWPLAIADVAACLCGILIVRKAVRSRRAAQTSDH